MKQLKRFILPIIIVFVLIALAIFDPKNASNSVKVIWDYFKEMALIIPPVFILMGLMDIWIPKDKIKVWLGKGSGLKGALISIGLGTLPTGPLYVAFPMTASLIKKGAGISNMVLFLGSWAALKIPQLMVEIEFLGLPFTAMRFVLTLAMLVIIGFIMEKILHKYPDRNWEKIDITKEP